MQKENPVSATPRSEDWNRFWHLDQTKRFTRVSLSKQRIMKVVQPYVGNGKTALDAGCGSGFFAGYFCDAQMDTVALDYSDEALQIAKTVTQGRARIVKEDLLSENLGCNIKKRFDVIFSDGLFEHFSLEDQDRILQNFQSLLTDNGVIITFVPNQWSPWQLIRPFFMPGIKETPFVLRALIDLHHRNNLRVIAKGGINTFPFAYSPDGIVGKWLGMLLFVIAK